MPYVDGRVAGGNAAVAVVVPPIMSATLADDDAAPPAAESPPLVANGCIEPGTPIGGVVTNCVVEGLDTPPLLLRK